MSEGQSTTTVRDIPQFPGYRVNDSGQVFELVGGQWAEMRYTRSSGIYPAVTIRSKSKRHLILVHRLVASMFLPRPQPNQTVVRHLNGEAMDNRVANPAWGTQADNMADCIRHGRTLKGTKNPNAKLNDRVVIAARILVEEGYSTAAVGAFLGVGRETVRRATNGEQWRHVNE